MDSDISQEHIYTVSELNDEVSGLLSSNFGIVWIEGEISNYMKSAAGHAYFSLKDSDSSVRCAMFRIQNQSIGFAMEDGQHILAKAKVGLYQARGEYQLVIEYAEQAGEGLLRQKFELLKNKLQSEGLFDPVHKQTLPYIPNKVGIISSPKGAAIQDIFDTIKRRFSLVELLVYPTMVQGKEASQQICQAIASANQDNQCSVIILARGGGSLEDLWCFNDEEVARSIFGSKIPVVTGIGHEIDQSVADIVSHTFYKTPTACAIGLIGTVNEFVEKILSVKTNVVNLAHNKLTLAKSNHSNLQSRTATIAKASLTNSNEVLKRIKERVSIAVPNIIQQNINKLHVFEDQIRVLDPKRLLARGWSITRTQNGEIISSTNNLFNGDEIVTIFEDGTVKSTINEVVK